MPLETIDKDPFWGKRFRMTAEDMRLEKEKLLAAGRDAWNAATRKGRNVKARTEGELAELGRKTIQAKARAQEKARSAGEFIRQQIDAQRDATVALAGFPQAAAPLLSNFMDMREAGWKGGDKYFHCKGNCEAAQAGFGGEQASALISGFREEYGAMKGDPPWDRRADEAANRFGRDRGAADKRTSCGVQCAAYRPKGLPPEY